MKKIILPFLLLALTLSSCYDKAKITIKNNVHNATLEQVSWDNHSFESRSERSPSYSKSPSSLLPGEESTITVYEHYKYRFPRKSVVKFYMKREGNQVYLETKYSFILDAKDNLLIVISDTTQVVNPALIND